MFGFHLISFDIIIGMFVQLIANAVMFAFGFGVNFVRNFPPFQPVAAIGGLLYTTGDD
jgi:hypothetical protein